MNPELRLVSNNTAVKETSVEKVNRTYWKLVRTDDTDECHLFTGEEHQATVAFWQGVPKTDNATDQGCFAALRRDGSIIQVCDSFTMACSQAMISAGAIATLPKILTEHFSAQAVIHGSRPGDQERKPTPQVCADATAPILTQVCALLDEVLKARLTTIRDTSNDWPVVVTMGSFRPDLEQKVRDILLAAGYCKSTPSS